ncbi:vitamin K epoxide reductase family protein [Trichothermofontia sp.]
MNRRRATPWIHRWSRPIMGAIALVGACGTAYLTLMKLVGDNAVCPTEGCDLVLNSAYATVFGLPLALFGFLAYTTMAIAAVAPLWLNADTQKNLRTQLETWTWLYLFVGGTAMTIFSAYLMYILFTQIQGTCIYCVTSAGLSLSLFVLSIIGHDWEDIGQLVFTGLIVGMVTLIGTLGIYANVSAPERATNAATGQSVGVPPPVQSESGPAEIALAQHLTAIGAKVFTAYWCPACRQQKELFGEPAVQDLDIVECDPKGQNARVDLCQAAPLEGFPTWEIKGQFYTGVRPLNDLADLSNYTGPRNFRQR